MGAEVENFRLSRNFWYSEVVASRTADEHGIDNTPGPDHIAAATALALMSLQRLRDLAGRLGVNSWYRCPELNSHPNIRGSRTSQHLTGEAADVFSARHDPQKLAQIAWDHDLPVDQLIVYPERGIVHISYSRTAKTQRNQFLVNRDDGKGPVPWR